MNSMRHFSKRTSEKMQEIIKQSTNFFNKPDNICQVYCVIMEKKGGYKDELATADIVCDRRFIYESIR